MDLLQYRKIYNINTHGVKYIGSKKKLLPFIGEIVMELDVSTAIDVFSGTTRVAQYLRQLGIQTHTSDLSWATTCYANTYVHNKKNSHLQPHIDHMNTLPGIHGWLSQNYSGDSSQTDDTGNGRCFQLKNTMRADAARDYIDTLSLAPWEASTLITAVIRGLDAVDNTVGVQQAYLKQWCDRSFNDIKFQVPPQVDGDTGIHFEGNCLDIEYPEVDLTYLDPPYSPHSYSTYYHIWDSIARWDKPNTGLKARRRMDRVVKSDEYNTSMTSDWNYKNTAMDAFGKLIQRLPSRYLLISYSNESIVDQDSLMELCEKHGKVTLTEIDYKRNIMSQIGNAKKNNPDRNQKNKELLILIEKST